MQPFYPEDALSAKPPNRCAMAEPCIADPFAEDFEFGNVLDVEPFSGVPEAHSNHPTVLTHVANISEIFAVGAQPQVQKRLRHVVAGCLADNVGSIDCVEANAKRPCLASSRVGAGEESRQSLVHLSLWPETKDAITKREVMRRAACILSTAVHLNDSSTVPALQGPQREARDLSYLNPHKAATATQEYTTYYADIISRKHQQRQSGIDMDKSETCSHGVADSMSNYLRYLEFEALILRSKLERKRMACLQNDKVSTPSDQNLASV